MPTLAAERLRPSAAALFAFLFILSTNFTAFARESADTSVKLQSGLDLGVAAVGDDVFLLTTVEQRIEFRGLSVIFAGPFRLRMIDNAPSDHGLLRRQDWDEPSDFARIVPQAAYFRSFQDGYIDIFAGRLNNFSIDTGTITSHYFNSTDMDTYSGGISLRGEYVGSGAELLLDNFIAPSIFAGQVFLAPAAWFTEAAWARRTAVAFLFGTDFRAPLLAFETGKRVLSVFGGALRYAVVDNDRVTVRPSVAAAFMGGDAGLHSGTYLRWVVAPDAGIGVSIYGEYRYCGSKYYPSLLNPFYNFNRFHFESKGAVPYTTFADRQSYGEDIPASHGFKIDFSFEWKEYLALGAVYDRIGRNRPHWVAFYLSVTPVKGYRFRGFFGGQDIEGGRAIFSGDSIFGVEARGKVWGPLDLFFHFTRQWRDIPHSSRIADEFGGGVGVAVTY